MITRVAVALLLLSLAPRAHAVTRSVTNVPELVNAVSVAAPGDLIVVNPGSYVLSDPIVLAASGSASAPILLRAAMPATVTLRGNSSQTTVLSISGGFWNLDNLTITGGAQTGIAIAASAHDLKLRHLSFNDAGPIAVRGDCGAIANGCPRVTVEDSDFLASAPIVATPCYGAGIDVSGGEGWIIQRNAVRGFRMDALSCPGATAFGVVLHENVSGALVDANFILDNFIGVSFGGTDTAVACSLNGATLANSVVSTSDEAGMTVVNACGVAIFNNTFWKNGVQGIPRSIDARGSFAMPRATNNILNAGIRDLDGAIHEETNSYLLANSADASLFEGATTGNFRILATATPLIDKGLVVPQVTHDFEGRARPLGAAYDIGAIEYPPGGYTTTPGPGNGGGSGGDGGFISPGGGGGGGGGFDPDGFGGDGCSCRVVPTPFETVAGLFLAALVIAALRLSSGSRSRSRR